MTYLFNQPLNPLVAALAFALTVSPFTVMADAYGVETGYLVAIEDAASATSNGPEEVVYDSIRDNLFYGQGLGSSDEVGETIHLSGTARIVTAFDVALGANTSPPFKLKFYNPDGPNSSPGSLIWESPSRNYPLDPGAFNRKILTFNVPNVEVPDSFVWTIELLDRSQGNVVIGTIENNRPPIRPPLVGQAGVLWEERPSTGFFTTFTLFDLGARVTAVPEPTAAALLLAACAVVALPCRLRPSRRH